MSERDRVGAALSEAEATCSSSARPCSPSQMAPPQGTCRTSTLDMVLTLLKNTNFKVKPN